MPAPTDSSTLPLPSWRVRLAWLALYWVLGVAAMALVAGLLRLLMRAAGLGL